MILGCLTDRQAEVLAEMGAREWGLIDLRVAPPGSLLVTARDPNLLEDVVLLVSETGDVDRIL